MKKGEIDRAAHYLVDQYGLNASMHVRENLDWARARDNAVDIKNWTSILKAIAEI